MVPKSPSWPIILTAGSSGGIVNWIADTHIIGLLVFIGLSAALVLFTRQST